MDIFFFNYSFLKTIFYRSIINNTLIFGKPFSPSLSLEVYIIYFVQFVLWDYIIYIFHNISGWYSSSVFFAFLYFYKYIISQQRNFHFSKKKNCDVPKKGRGKSRWSHTSWVQRQEAWRERNGASPQCLSSTHPTLLCTVICTRFANCGNSHLLLRLGTTI